MEDGRLLLIFDSASIVQRTITTRGYRLFNLSFLLFHELLHLKISLVHLFREETVLKPLWT